MSKLSFRARALDASKPMPIYLSEELPDLPEYLSINRSVPQMPSGMEKEEESERHLQEAISTGKVIPTPEIFSLVDMHQTDRFDLLYPAKFRLPKQYIHYQSYSFDNEVAEYDMDSEDEAWLNAQSVKMDGLLTADQFEEMMDRLEKGSGQQVVTLKEAKMLVRQDDDLTIAVYDYWLNKRLRLQYPLIPAVKTEKAIGNTQSANPYVAFRRRLEKMQTRKNRKNDEVSYEKMLKLRRDLSRAVTLLEMIKRREKMKKEHLHLTVEIFEKRHAAGDYSGQLMSELNWQKWQRSAPTASSIRPSTTPAARPSFTCPPLANTSPSCRPSWPLHSSRSVAELKTSKRSYKKRKHSKAHSNLSRSSANYSPSDVVIDMVSSDEEDRCRPRHARSRLPPMPPAPLASSANTAESWQQESEPDGEFTFRRKRGCQYHEPVSWWLDGEWCAPPPVPLPPVPRRFQLGSLHRPLGLVRRRLGRGGRVVVDRACAGSLDSLRELGVDVSTDASLLHLPLYEPAPPSKSPIECDGASEKNVDTRLPDRELPSSPSSHLQSGSSRFRLRPCHSPGDSTASLSEAIAALSRNGCRSPLSSCLLTSATTAEDGGEKVAVVNGSETPPSPPLSSTQQRRVATAAQCGVAVRPSWQQKCLPPLPADTPPDPLHLVPPSSALHGTSNHIREVTDVCKEKQMVVPSQRRFNKLSLNAT